MKQLDVREGSGIGWKHRNGYCYGADRLGGGGGGGGHDARTGAYKVTEEIK